jgi:AraC family ethanolamine operon transcriptional activator
MNSIKDPILRIFPSFSLSYQNFDDGRSFHKSLNRFDVDTWQLSSGKFQGKLIEVSTNNMQIDRHCHNSLLRIEGTPTKNWVFGIPVHPLCLLFEQKYQLEDNYILMSPPESGFKMVQKSAYDLFVIYCSEKFFFNLCQQYHLPEPRQLLGEAYYHPSAMMCYSEQLKILRQGICQFFHHGFLSLFAQPKDSLLSSLVVSYFQQILEEEIPKRLILTLAEAQNIQPKKVILKRASILNQAEAFIKTYIKADINIEDICRETGVSKRTLEYIFQDFYGLSPKAYLKQLRLNQFHIVLKTQYSAGYKIKEIAEEWGFWHTGRLASDYFRLFGELPSESVKS